MSKPTNQAFTIYPAMDLRHGACVRLYQGDYTQTTIYQTDPAQVLQEFIHAGANWIHIVDLDGAQNPQARQDALITALIKQHPVKIQIGGGIRTQEQVKKLLDHGVNRVIIGSLAVQQPETIKTWWHYFGSDHLVLAVDVTLEADGQAYIATQAWQARKQFLLTELLEFYQTAHLKQVLCTDITRDGTLQGPNTALYQQILARFPTLALQASGGVQSLHDIQTLRDEGLAGVIIGKALYEKKFLLKEALIC
jgi:phosphoribosylformimino-5-aminoimidazole carboxamide ribotide isomerase